MLPVANVSAEPNSAGCTDWKSMFLARPAPFAACEPDALQSNPEIIRANVRAGRNQFGGMSD